MITKNLCIGQIIVLSVSLVACVGNKTYSAQPINNTGNSLIHLSSYHSSGIIPESDIYQIDYRLGVESNSIESGIHSCSSLDNYCVDFKYLAMSGYYAKSGTQNVWVMDNFPAQIKITFNKDTTDIRSFSLADVGINISGNEPSLGDITSINKTDCTTVLSSKTSLVGKSCNINFIYTGHEMRSDINQTVHFKFSTNDSDDVDFKVPVYNKLLSDKVAILSAGNGFFMDSPILQKNLIGFSEIFKNHFELKNVGDVELLGAGSKPTISAIISNQFKPLFGKFSLQNADFTNIGTKGLEAGGTTTMPLSYLLPEDTKIGLTLNAYGVLVYQYYNNLYNVYYPQKFIISSGVIKPIANIDVNLGTGGSFILQKTNLDVNLGGKDLIAYVPKLKDFKLYAEYNTDIFVTRSLVGSNGYYSYSIGDYPLGTNVENIAKELSFSYESDCFDTGISSKYYDLSLPRNCPVSVSYNGNLTHEIGQKKPLSLTLIAEYELPFGNRKMKQILGNLIFSATAVPVGSYKDSCSNYTMDSSMYLHAKCSSGVTGQYIDSSLNYGICLRYDKNKIENKNGNLVCL